MDEQRIIRSTAKPGAGLPPGAANSVFNVATPPPKKKTARTVVRIDPASVKIYSGVPLPAVTTGQASPWPAVYKNMKKGDMVKLTHREAVAFLSWAKKHKAVMTRRALPDEVVGVWRME